MNLYEVLEVTPATPFPDIRAAYRRLAMQHHPDRGGDPEKMRAIAHAWAVLSDATARARYDATGQDDPSALTEAEVGLIEVASQIIPMMVRGANLIDCMKEQIRTNLLTMQQCEKEKRRDLEALQLLHGRVKCTGKRNLIGDLIEKRIGAVETTLVELADGHRCGRDMLLLLKEYEQVGPVAIGGGVGVDMRPRGGMSIFFT